VEVNSQKYRKFFDVHILDETIDDLGFRYLSDIFFLLQKEERSLADAIKYAQKFTCIENSVMFLWDTIYRSNDEKNHVSYS
jgi:dTDP-glucose pyrophosphorylase